MRPECMDVHGSAVFQWNPDLSDVLAGSPIGFAGRTGPSFGWLHVDPTTLAEHAAALGWRCEVIAADDAGNYAARLSR